MKDQDLDVITPITLNDFWLIPLKADVVKLFENKEVEFQIKVRDKKLIIESPEILANQDFQDRPIEREAINV